jgi:hypothetical protein
VADPPVGLAHPVEPLDFAATTSPGVVMLTWSDVSNETYYRIQRAPSPLNGTTGTYVTVISKTAQNATSHDDFAMEPNTRYRYRLRACNADGCGTWTYLFVESDAQGPPPPPTNVRVRINASGGVQINWADGPAEDEYRVHRALAPQGGPVGVDEIIARPNAGVRTYTDRTPPYGNRVRYRLRACNEEGCSADVTIYIYVPNIVVPPIPTGFSGDGSSGDVVLTWDDHEGETVYEIVTEVAPLQGGTSPGTDDPPPLPANTTTYTDTQVLAGTRYRFRIRACNEVGCSEYRATLVTVAGASATPPTPANFAGDPSATDVVLTWTEGANETEYRIQRAMVREDGSLAYLENFTVGANATTYTDTTIGHDRRYRYRIRACRPEACSGWATIYVNTP